MKKIILILAAMLTFAACTKEGDVIYQTDPADAPSAKPSAAQDTVRRLFIVAAASYDDYLRQNNNRLAANPYTDLLYLETSEPLDGKGSTLYLPYYGAMYEAGGLAQSLASEVLLVAANPKVESVSGAVDGFTDGFNADYIQYPERLGISKTLVTEYLFMYDRQWTGYFKMLVPVCGGAARTFQYLNDMMGGYDLAGVNVAINSTQSSLSCVKHIDRAVALCISQWLSPEGMPKHQSLGLADGYTGVVVTPDNSFLYSIISFSDGYELTDEMRAKIHEEAIRKEAEYEK